MHKGMGEGEWNNAGTPYMLQFIFLDSQEIISYAFAHKQLLLYQSLFYFEGIGNGNYAIAKN
jgi:hypothetical protein